MLKVLIIGCGNIAGGFDAASNTRPVARTHAAAYTAHGQFSISACVEPDADKRAAFMTRWAVPNGYDSLDHLMATHDTASKSERFDVISICSPTTAHHADVLQALHLKPQLIFCEKPVCADVAQTQSVVQRCFDQGVLFAVNHNRRWDPEVTRLRDQLQSGQWGEIRLVTGQYNKGVLNNGSHMIDLLHDLLGPLTLIGCGTPLFDYSESDPSVPASLVSAAGVPIALTCGDASDYSLFELQVVTQRGVIAMEDGGLRWRTRLNAPSTQFAGYRALDEGQFSGGQYLQTMTNAIANIYRSVTNGEALASTGQTAMCAQLICQQMRTHSLQRTSAADAA